MPDFLPRREADLLVRSATFCAAVAADASLYGVGPDLLATLRARHAAFDALFAASADPARRSPAVLAAKDTSRRELVASIRAAAAVARSRREVGDSERIALGLRPRRTGRSPRLPRPAAAPRLWVASAAGWRVELRLADADAPGGRAKPRGVESAEIFRHVGPAAPEDFGEWHYVGGASRNRLTMTLPTSIPLGSTLWVTARWSNRRAEAGPTARPLRILLGGGATSAARAA